MIIIALAGIIIFCPLRTCTCLVRDLFLMLLHLSGTVCLAKLGHQTHSHLLNHLWNLTFSSYPIDCHICVCVCVCMCLCVHAYVCVCLHMCEWVWSDCVLVLCFVMGYVFQFWEKARKRAHYCYYNKSKSCVRLCKKEKKQAPLHFSQFTLDVLLHYLLVTGRGSHLQLWIQ